MITNEVAELLASVDELRAEVDRLRARVAELESNDHGLKATTRRAIDLMQRFDG
jgi:hypothetical protein